MSDGGDTPLGAGWPIAVTDAALVSPVDGHTVDIASIAGRVAHGRARLGLRQQELARRAGLSEVYINRLERGGVHNPKVHDLARVAGALGVSLEALLCGDAPPGDGALAALAAREPRLAGSMASLARGLRFAEPEDRAFVLDHLEALAARFGR
jgi:transcriptional regulator with XRE-family HTH domain